MVEIILLILRYLFLVLFYVFLIKLTLTIVDDLRSASQGEKTSDGEKQLSPGDGAELVVVNSIDQGLPPGTKIPLAFTTVLGRSDHSDVKILDDFISSKHAQIIYRDNQYWLEDLDSLNGTYLNGVKVTETTAIADGDSIRVGGVSFEFARWAYEMGPDHRGWLGQTE